MIILRLGKIKERLKGEKLKESPLEKIKIINKKLTFIVA